MWPMVRCRGSLTTVQWKLGLRAVLAVPTLAILGLEVMHLPALAGAACLTALLIAVAGEPLLERLSPELPRRAFSSP